jgi:hypothetical protein
LQHIDSNNTQPTSGALWRANDKIHALDGLRPAPVKNISGPPAVLTVWFSLKKGMPAGEFRHKLSLMGKQ